jgi:hypothetical protein
MADEIIERKVYDYLYRHFPIQRLKDDATKRFRRGIMLYDSLSTEKMFFQPKANAQKLYSALYDDLQLVFGLNTEDLTPILFKYLYLNKYYKLKD